MAKRLTKDDLKPGVACLTETNFNKDYTLNEEATRAQIDWVIDRGAIGVWTRGLAGDMWQLDMDTSKQMFKVIADQAKGRAHVAAGCSSLRVNEVVELVNYADKVGCDFAWITPYIATIPKAPEIYRYYQTIIDNTSLPLALYHSPNPGGLYLTPQFIKSILNMSDRFIAMKDSSGDFNHHTEVVRLGIPKKVAFYPVTRVMVPALIMGARGSLIHPEAVPLAVAAYEAWKKGDMEKAWRLQIRMNGADPILMPTFGTFMPSPIKPWTRVYTKTKISMIMGIEMGPPMNPANPTVTNAEMEEIKKEIAEWRPLDIDAPTPST